MSDVELFDDERIDTLHIENLKIIQSNSTFSYGIDAVILSDFVKCKINDKICDLGTGTGIIPLLISKTKNCSSITALEIQDKSFSMATRSVLLNDLQDKIEVVQGDIKSVTDYIPKNSMNVVVCNPPYMKLSSGKENKTDSLTIARHEILCNAEDVIKAASLLLNSNGHFFMIHRCQRLQEFFVLMNKYGLQVKRLQFVHPTAEEEATMVLIEAKKCGLPELNVERPLVVYKTKGIYSSQICKIYGVEQMKR